MAEFPDFNFLQFIIVFKVLLKLKGRTTCHYYTLAIYTQKKINLEMLYIKITLKAKDLIC